MPTVSPATPEERNIRTTASPAGHAFSQAGSSGAPDVGRGAPTEPQRAGAVRACRLIESDADAVAFPAEEDARTANAATTASAPMAEAVAATSPEPSGSPPSAPHTVQQQRSLSLTVKGGRVNLKMRILEAAVAWRRVNGLEDSYIVVLIAIASAMDKETGACRRTYQQLADATGRSISTICRALDALEAVGLIKRITRYAGSGQFKEASDIVLIDPPPVPLIAPPVTHHRATGDATQMAPSMTVGSATGGAEDSLKRSPLRDCASGDATPLPSEQRATPEQWAELRRELAKIKKASKDD